MSYEIAAKIAYDEANETLTIFSCSNNVFPKSYSYGHVISASEITTSPDYCVTDYSKLMSILFKELVSRNITLKSTVAVKYRNAYLVTINSINNTEEVQTFPTEEYFNIFLAALSGEIKVEKGKFIVSIDSFGSNDPVYYKNAKYYTRAEKSAKVFNTKEEASLIAQSRNGTVITLSN